MPLSYRTQMNGLHVTPPAAAAPSYTKYTSVKMFTLLVQTIGFIAAYLLGLFYNYERLAITACPTPDYLPSVSETTGDHQPGQLITRLIVSFTLFPCMVDAFLYYHLFSTQAPTLFERKWWYRWLNRTNLLVIMVRLLFLYTVTFIGLSENEDLHVIGWCGFLLLALPQEVILLILFGSLYGKSPIKLERTAFKVRCVLLLSQLIGVVGFMNFSMKSFWYCQPYALTIATIFEFLIFGCVYGFEWMKLFDFRKIELSIISNASNDKQN